MSDDVQFWYLAIGQCTFINLLLGYFALGTVHEMVTKRDRSVPVRWVWDKSSRAYLAMFSVTFIAVFGLVTVPLTVLIVAFFIGIIILGVLGLVLFLAINLEYKLPPPDEERPTFIHRPWGYRH